MMLSLTGGPEVIAARVIYHSPLALRSFSSGWSRSHSHPASAGCGTNDTARNRFNGLHLPASPNR
jgi:hypothetical protein